MYAELNPLTFDPKEFATRWFFDRMGGRGLNKSCLSAVEQAAEGFYDWILAVTHPVHHHVVADEKLVAELVKTPVAKSALAKCVSGMINFEECRSWGTDDPWEKFFQNALHGIFASQIGAPDAWAGYYMGKVQEALINNFRKLVALPAYHGRSLPIAINSLSKLAKVEAVKWSSREVAGVPVWTPGAYLDDPEKDEVIQDIKSNLLKRMQDAGSKAVPVDPQLFAEVISRMPFDNSTVANMIKNADAALPQSSIARRWLATKALKKEAHSLDDEILSKLIDVMIDIHGVSPQNESPFSSRGYGTVYRDENDLISLLRYIAAERPNVLTVNGGNLLKRLWNMAPTKDRDYRQLNFPSFDALRNHRANAAYYSNDGMLDDLKILMLELPNLIAGSTEDKTFCAKFRKMANLPYEMRVQLLGVMMQYPKIYNMSVNETPLTTHIAEQMLMGLADINEVDGECIISLKDGTVVKLGPHTGANVP